MAKTQPSSAERVRRRREKLRQEGLRPLQLWLRDAGSPGFVEEAARQSRLVAAVTPDDELDFLDDLADELSES
jgi:hypothetical protein